MGRVLDIMFLGVYKATGDSLAKTVVVFCGVLVFVLVLFLGRDR